jgi:MFS family permease
MGVKLPTAIYVLGATSLLNDAASEMIYPLMPVFLSTVLGASAVTLGIIEGAADAMSSVLKLASGWLSDRVGRRKPLVVAGYAIASAARPLVAFAATPMWVLGVRLVDRFGKGLRSSPRDALIADLAPPALHGRAFGVHEAMDHAGAVVGPLMAYGLLALGLGLRSVFLLAAIPAVAACLLVALAVKEVPKKDATVVVEPTVEPTAETTTGSKGSVALLSGPHAGSFVAYLSAITLFALGNSSDAFLLLRAYDAGLPVAMAPLLWAAHHVVKSAASAWGGGLSDRIGRRRALGLGWLVYALIYAGFAMTTSRTAIIGLFLAYGLYFALVGGAQKALVSEIVPAAARARGFGAYHLVVGLAALPASLLFGLLYERFGAPTAFGIGAVLALVATAVLPASRMRRSPL